MSQFSWLRLFVPAALFAAGAAATAQTGAAPGQTPEAQLGGSLFFDTSLSSPPGQSCAACHAPGVGFTGPLEAVNKAGGVYPGAVHGRFGNRKPPTSSYAASPVLGTKTEDGKAIFYGGSFWDGRATGARLGSTLAEQALGPFTNPLEQNLPDGAAVVAAVCGGPHAAMLREVAKKRGIADACAPANAAAAYDVIGHAIAAYETSPAAQPFSSRYDRYLSGKARFSEQERRGLTLFAVKGKCASCHPHQRGPKGEPPLFTDFTYDNIGLPRNPENPFYKMGPEFNPDGAAWRDEGLGGFLKTDPRYAPYADENLGKFKVPTLRNVNRRPSPGFVKAYGHNGVFKSLEQVVHFYNTRDVLPACGSVKTPEFGKNCWPAPEEVRNMERETVGKLGLTADEEAAIVAFLKTLDDEQNR
ncbi:MAG: cytochrome-c peroxidase [Acidobacteriota bacterium]